MLVVNSRSWASRTIANHYAQLRRIPPSNVVHMDWPHNVYSTTLDVFRDELLRPVFQKIERRKLANQIDYIVWSADFPYAIDFSESASATDRFPSASITGLTYLSMLSPSNVADFRDLKSNWYAVGRTSSDISHPSRGFRGPYQWNRDGAHVTEEGQSYVLSTMLGYTSGRGNSVAEILSMLGQSVLSDGTRPRGTVYFADSGDEHRSGTRQPHFGVAIRKLRELGVDAAEISAKYPVGKQDILGAMLGAASVGWSEDETNVVPGAIVENLTSYGGILRPNASQTPVSSFVRQGAAGTSGTVIEPYAIANKFPDPMLHVHYASGCSLAESFYQSVLSPYQLLVLGDALCQPWAPIPAVTVQGPEPLAKVQGIIELTPACHRPAGSTLEAAQFQLFVDGRLYAAATPGAAFRIDTTALSDGYHEFRIVAVENSPIQAQGRTILPLFVNNHDRLPTCHLLGPNGHQRTYGTALQLELRAPGAHRIVVIDNRRPIAEVKSEEGTVVVPTSSFGLGPITLSAVAVYEGEEKSEHAFAAPLQLTIVPPNARDGQSTPPPGAEEGLLLTQAGSVSQRLVEPLGRTALEDAGLQAKSPFQLDGHFKVTTDGVHQYQLEYVGTVQMKVDGRVAFRATHENRERVYIPLFLGVGWHELEISGTLEDVDSFSIEMGQVGTKPLDGGSFRSTRTR